MVKPYKDMSFAEQVKSVKRIVRIFSEDTPEEDLVWHRDKQTRLVVPKTGEGWKFQRDNKQPVEIKPWKPFFIMKEEFHRLHKGTDDLVLWIFEDPDDET